MNEAGGDEGGGGSSSSNTGQQTEDKSSGGKVLGKLSAIAIGPGWTKVSCPCCVSEGIEPLVLVKLGEKVRPETKRWLIRLIGAPQKDGGEGLDSRAEVTFLSALIAALQRKHADQTFMSFSFILILETYCTGESFLGRCLSPKHFNVFAFPCQLVIKINLVK